MALIVERQAATKRLPKTIKVAAYARVSSAKETMQQSLAAQISYYSRMIHDHPGWQYAGVYADEAKTGTKEEREQFQRLIADCRAGRIDLILTKSVSRFARNTVDSLTTIRKLKEKGVEVFFEKESIWTFDGKGELLLTIMSSLAQEESRSISENVTWGCRKRFADGKVSMCYGSFLGYRKGRDGKPEIVPEEAEIVRRIYRMFMKGNNLNEIARYLNEHHIPTARGKSTWYTTTVQSILQNERYMGDAILQKSFTVDFLNKKHKKNEGELPKYYVTNSHPGIIGKAEWKRVQVEMAKRYAKGKYQNSRHALSAKIICGDCGAYYGRKTWHSNTDKKKIIWQCNAKFKNAVKCKTPNVTEEEVKALFISAVSKLLSDRTKLLLMRPLSAHFHGRKSRDLCL